MKNGLMKRNPFNLWGDDDYFGYPLIPFRYEWVDMEIPKTDLVEKEDHYELKMDMPGFKKEEVTVDIQDDIISVSAKHEENKDEEKDGRRVLYERRSSSIKRSFRFPGVAKEDVKASLNDGVLELTIQKRQIENKETQKIEIE